MKLHFGCCGCGEYIQSNHISMVYMGPAQGGVRSLVKGAWNKCTDFSVFCTGEKLIWQTLGVRGHLPSGYVVSTLWVLVKFNPTIPSRSMVGIFQKYSLICPPKTHWVKVWVLCKRTHQFGPTIPSRYMVGAFQKYLPICPQHTHWVKHWVFFKSTHQFAQKIPTR